MRVRLEIVQRHARGPQAGHCRGADRGAGGCRLAPEIELRLGDRNQGGLHFSGTVGIVVMMGLLTLLPTLLLMMTSFTRSSWSSTSFVRRSARRAHRRLTSWPHSLLLSSFVMAPTLSEVNQSALQPWMTGEIEQGEMLAVGSEPFREFVLSQKRDRDLATFTTTGDIPRITVVFAFVTSELRTAFRFGFALLLPFVVIDVVVARC